MIYIPRPRITVWDVVKYVLIFTATFALIFTIVWNVEHWNDPPTPQELEQRL